MTISENLSPEEIARRVRPYVTEKRVWGSKIKLTVDDARIGLRNGYWRIPIRPSHWPEPSFPFYEALADLEEEVQEKEHIKVTIASGDPLSDEIAYIPPPLHLSEEGSDVLQQMAERQGVSPSAVVEMLLREKAMGDRIPMNRQKPVPTTSAEL